MTTCSVQEHGTIELFFYEEVDAADRPMIEQHLRGCRVCADALHELKVIRTALASRPDVSGPESGDWSAFMRRLDETVLRDLRPRQAAGHVVPFAVAPPSTHRPLVMLLATAALLAVVTVSVFFASRAGRTLNELQPAASDAQVDTQLSNGSSVRAGLRSVGLRHIERSKLVVLGLATKEGATAPADWTYERELASALLSDTRMYRMAAEDSGLTSLAGVMKDLELVLLQASLAETGDTSALPQIQRLIHKRGLVHKMDVVGTTGLLP